MFIPVVYEFGWCVYMIVVSVVVGAAWWPSSSQQENIINSLITQSLKHTSIITYILQFTNTTMEKATYTEHHACHVTRLNVTVSMPKEGHQHRPTQILQYRRLQSSLQVSPIFAKEGYICMWAVEGPISLKTLWREHLVSDSVKRAFSLRLCEESI